MPAATGLSANGLLARWIFEEETASYAKDVVRSDFESAGEDDVVRKVLGDLTSAGVEVDETEIREALGHKMVEARRQIIQENS